MKVQYVEIFYPGSFFSESEIRKVKSRNKIELPKNAFGYRFFEREEVKKGKEVLKGENKNYSGTYYKGEAFTLKQLENKYPNERILISNMKNNGHKKVIKTIRGNWQPFLENDVLI